MTAPERGPIDTRPYLAMARAHYARMVAQSNYASDGFTEAVADECVVGWYAEHERYDYERWLLDGLAIDPGAVALDYGCGPGRMILRLAPRFARIDGIDISPEVIEVARTRTAGLGTPPRLWTTEGDDLPADTTGAYDLAFSVICLQHICVYSIRRRILAGLYRALAPGGVLTFQMGYGPGHRAMIEYHHEVVQATATNGAADVSVHHPGEIAADLDDIGFVNPSYALTPAGPGDTHAAWIFVRAQKPAGAEASRVRLADALAPGFVPLVRDDEAVVRATRIYRKHGIPRRRRHLEAQIAALTDEVARLRAHAAATTTVPDRPTSEVA